MFFLSFPLIGLELKSAIQECSEQTTFYPEIIKGKYQVDWFANLSSHASVNDLYILLEDPNPVALKYGLHIYFVKFPEFLLEMVREHD